MVWIFAVRICSKSPFSQPPAHIFLQVLLPVTVAVEGVWENIQPSHPYVYHIAHFAARNLLGTGAIANNVLAASGFVCILNVYYIFKYVINFKT